MSRSSGPRSARDAGPEYDQTAVQDPVGADSMEALLAAVAAAPPVAIERTQGLQIEEGTVIDGAYRVLRRLGGGGMGVVYLAEHMELERRVALKLHLGSVDSHELARLRREARVMAKLSHPNVLTVHGVGTHEGRMFIAMEFAEGGTLTDWIEGGPHHWRETVEMLVQAGRGLAAAHHVGVVHRDFKPDNVLIGADGRPRVADFGLARRSDEAEAEVETTRRDQALGDIQRFTVTGAVVGTPAYMSPEQFDGFEVGPATDQFAFCVVLYQALTGRRPFSGNSLVELMEAVHAGKPEPVLGPHRLPRRLVAAVIRGLRPVPGDRFPSMQVLVAELERIAGARRRRRQWAAAGTGLGLALLAGGGVVVMAQPRPCEDSERELGAAWSDERREAVASAWAGHEGTTEALAALDGWAAAWGAQRREVCEATRVREEASELVLGLRMACLDRMAARLDGLTSELLSRSDDERLDQALVDSSLPSLAECEDVDALERLTNRYADRSERETAAQDQAWVEAAGLLAQTETRLRLGREGVVELAEQAAALGREHRLPRIESKALEFQAEGLAAQGDAQGAQALRERALELAVEGGSDDAVADLALSQAEAALAEGRLDVAAVHLRYFEVFAWRVANEAVLGPYRQRARVIEGNLHIERGEYEAAVERLAPVALDGQVDAMLRRAALMRLGRAYKALDRLDEAVRVWSSLIELLVALRGPEHPDLAAVLNNIATVRIELEQPREALQDLRRAESIVEATWGPEHPLMTLLWSNQGLALRQLGEGEQARALQERSLALRTALHGAHHPSLAVPLDELAELAREAGQYDRALEILTQGLEIRRQAHGPTHPLVAESLMRIARVHVDQGAMSQAMPLIEQALAIEGQDPETLAELELLAARALERAEPAEARRHGQAAVEHAGRAGAGGGRIRRETMAWMGHPPPGGAP